MQNLIETEKLPKSLRVGERREGAFKEIGANKDLTFE